MKKMKYYIVTNRQILDNNGIEQIDITNSGVCIDNLRFATFDSLSSNPDSYVLLPDKSKIDSEPYYFNINEPVKKGSERFFTELTHEMQDEGGDLLVLIHGFNVNWIEGINYLRSLEKIFINSKTSTIKHLVLISWPSRASILRYKLDTLDAVLCGTTIGRCFQLFYKFLNEAFTGYPGLKPCRHKVHLLCHSMGTFVLENMLKTILSDGARYHHVFDEVILAAADVDNTIFEEPNPFYYLNKLSRRVHIYCNRNDLVLKYSAKYENLRTRLGTNGPANIDALPNRVYVVDCTDASFNRGPGLQGRLIQHAYYLDVPRVSADINAVLQGMEPDQIEHRTQINQVKYRLKP